MLAIHPRSAGVSRLTCISWKRNIFQPVTVIFDLRSWHSNMT